MKTQTQICRAFDAAVARLQAHGLTVKSDGVFVIYDGERAVCTTESVDGLAAYADGLGYRN